jgi:hypothetical protein
MSFRKKLVIAMKNLYKLHPRNTNRILARFAYNHAAIYTFLTTAETGNINR